MQETVNDPTRKRESGTPQLGFATYEATLALLEDRRRVHRCEQLSIVKSKVVPAFNIATQLTDLEVDIALASMEFEVNIPFGEELSPVGLQLIRWGLYWAGWRLLTEQAPTDQRTLSLSFTKRGTDDVEPTLPDYPEWAHLRANLPSAHPDDDPEN